MYIMKNLLLTWETGTGKTYQFFNRYGSKKFLAIFPCRQLSYEAYLKYWNKQTDSLINWEVHYEPSELKNMFAVYENANIENIKNYDVIFIDEFHFITDEERGINLVSIIEKANELGIQVVWATATQNVDEDDLEKLQFAIEELKPFYKIPKKVEIDHEQFVANATKGMSSIVFVRYTPSEEDRVYWKNMTWLLDHEVAIVSASTRPAERLQNQLLFEKWEIKLILATNVLAQGLNFPAQQVMIYYNPYDSGEIILQKIGRLWRYGYNIDEVYYTAVEDIKIYKQKISSNNAAEETNYIPYIWKNIDKTFPNFMMRFNLGFYSNFKYSRTVLEYLNNNPEYLNKNQINEVKWALSELYIEEEKILSLLNLN